MKIVFIDAEYTGEHGRTTLVSLGLVTLEGERLYVTLNDYDRSQVTDWLRENVLGMIDESRSMSSREAYERVSAWLAAYAADERVSLVSAGLLLDVVLLLELWRHAQPDPTTFHYLHCLPSFLNHPLHLDLNTLLFLAGIDPGADREAFVPTVSGGTRHDALHDAEVVRACFLRLLMDGRLQQLNAAIGR